MNQLDHHVPRRALPHRHDVERGYMLVVMIFSVVLLTLFSLGFLGEGLADRAALNHYETSMRALEIAETGLARAEMEISGRIDADADGLGTVSGTFAGGTYEVDAVQDTADPALWTLTAMARHGLSARRIEVGIRETGEFLFPQALFGKDWVEFGGGGSSDCYDSGLGPWSTQITGSDAAGPYAQGCGDIGSNGFIKLSAGTIIRGDAIPGPLDVVTNGTVWGSTTPRATEVDVPDTPYAEFEAVYLANENGELDLAAPGIAYDPTLGTLKLNGSVVLVLPGGTYFFSDFDLGGNATLRVTGPSKLYLTGQVKLGGTVDNVSGRAADLLVFNHPYDLPPAFIAEGKELTSDGGWTSAMAVYAPALHFEIKSGDDLYGAAVAKSIKFGGPSRFHYDVSVRSVRRDGTPTGVERLYWLDLSPPARHP